MIGRKVGDLDDAAEEAGLAILGVFVYTFLLGTLESVPTAYSQELFVILLLTFVWLLSLGPPGERITSFDEVVPLYSDTPSRSESA